MFKKKINYILLFLITVSLIIVFYGLYTIKLSDKKIEETTIIVERLMDKQIEINDEAVNEKIEVSEKEEDDLLKDAIGLITFKGDKKIAIFNNPSDYYLKVGAGKLVNNSELNKYGNNILLGHRDGSFSVLKELEINDIFEIKTKDSVKNYKVVDIYVTTKIDPIPYQDSDDLKITLITCYPFVFVGNAPKRYVIIAKVI